MKRGIAILLAALLLGLCACSPTGADASEPGGTQPVTQPATQPATRGTEPETTSEPPTQETDPTAETPEEPEINEAFTAAVPDAPEGALGVMFNEPLDGLELTVTQNGPAGEYDRAYIVAKYVGSWVNVFGVTWSVRCAGILPVPSPFSAARAPMRSAARSSPAAAWCFRWFARSWRATGR